MSMVNALLLKVLNKSSIWRDIVRYRAYRRVTELLVRPVLSLELAAYTKGQCLLAADSMNLPPAVVGEVAAILHTRCGRGNSTLQDAVNLMVQAVEEYKARS